MSSRGIATVGPAFSLPSVDRTWPEGLFPAVAWTGAWPVGQFTEEPYEYPGLRPIGSFIVEGGSVTGLDWYAELGWVRRGSSDVVDLTGRRFVLGYGSNLDPAKLAEKLGGAVPVIRAAIRDHAAVWCDGRRGTDGSVVCTLAEVPGRIEVHGLVAVTDEQLRAMDGWEGHPTTYRREDYGGEVLMENGEPAADVLYYAGVSVARQPLLGHEGQPLLVAEVPYSAVDAIVAQR